MRGITFRAALGVAALASLGLVACAHSRSSESSNNGSSQKAAEAPKKAEKTKPPEGVAPPKGTLLAKVSIGMNDTEVHKAIGGPTGTRTYPTGKQAIPFYYGPDLMRTDWKYKGQGRVIFSHDRYGSNMKVIRIDYDPNESGQ